MAPSVFFIVATLIIDVLLEQFLICTPVQWGEHSRKRTIMDTSLSDIVEACGTQNSWIHQSGQYYYLQKRLIN